MTFAQMTEKIDQYIIQQGRKLKVRWSMIAGKYPAAHAQSGSHERVAEDSTASILATISHELRTSMNGVLGFAQLLLQSGLPKEQHRHVELIQEAGDSMMHLLNDILDIAKAEAGHMSVTAEAVELRPLADSCLALHSANARQKGVTLTADFAADVPQWLVSDAVRLRQILMNLLGNAVKFTHQGTVTLSAAAEKGMVVFAVEDSGIGIAADRLEAIFEPFIQADSTTAQEFGGTGLGLSISRTLAEMLGGTLSAQSVPGEGTRFELSIPIIERRKETLTGPSVAACPIPSLVPGGRILLADDNSSNRILGTAMLERCGQIVDTAANGQHAVTAIIAAKADERPFDLVLMDIQMPDCSGHQAAAILRSLGIGKDELPIIACSADWSADDAVAAQASGMQGHIMKPLQFDALADTLRQWVPAGPTLLPDQPGELIELADDARKVA